LERAARDPRLFAGVTFLLLVALTLRILGARGELWLDEIWSLHLVDQIKHGEALVALATDNNHYLNTLYLALVGPDQPPLVLRAFAILLGTAGVAMAGWLQRRRGAGTVLVTMALVAASYPLVNAGSEARGYAGMMLCAMASIDLNERALEERSARLGLWLGLSNVLGILFQPLMAGLIGSLGLWTVLVTWRERRSLRAAYETTRDLFGWTIRLLIPVLLVIGAAVRFGSGYVLGGVTPYSTGRMFLGIEQMFRFLLGLPEAVSDFAVPVLVLAAVALALALDRNNRRVWLYVVVMFAMPGAMALAHLPNTEIARYYLLPGLVFLLLLGELWTVLSARGPIARSLAGLAVLLLLLGNGLELRMFYAAGRGDVVAMLGIVTEQGAGPITGNKRDRPVLEYYMPRLGVNTALVDLDDVCKTPPRWILASDAGAEAPEEARIGTGCSQLFRKVAHHDSWGLSGLPWALYRAE
jgi:hypothetical protein